jgi:hypothetical protein
LKKEQEASITAQFSDPEGKGKALVVSTSDVARSFSAHDNPTEIFPEKFNAAKRQEALNRTQVSADLETRVKDVLANGKEPKAALVEALSSNRILAIGEEHTGPGERNPQRDLTAHSMAELKKAGATHLAVELPASKEMKAVIAEFNRDPSMTVQQLKEKMLGALDEKANKESAKAESFLKVLEAARANGIEIVPVDHADMHKLGASPLRDEAIAKNVSDILHADKSSKVVMFYGSEHLAGSKSGTNAVDHLRKDFGNEIKTVGSFPGGNGNPALGNIASGFSDRSVAVSGTHETMKELAAKTLDMGKFDIDIAHPIVVSDSKSMPNEGEHPTAAKLERRTENTSDANAGSLPSPSARAQLDPATAKTDRILTEHIKSWQVDYGPLREKAAPLLEAQAEAERLFREAEAEHGYEAAHADAFNPDSESPLAQAYREWGAQEARLAEVLKNYDVAMESRSKALQSTVNRQGRVNGEVSPKLDIQRAEGKPFDGAYVLGSGKLILTDKFISSNKTGEALSELMVHELTHFNQDLLAVRHLAENVIGIKPGAQMTAEQFSALKKAYAERTGINSLREDFAREAISKQKQSLTPEESARADKILDSINDFVKHPEKMDSDTEYRKLEHEKEAYYSQDKTTKSWRSRAESHPKDK